MSATAHISRRILRFSTGRKARAEDVLAVEEPLEIRIHNQPLSLTMRTPGHDAELAAGFLFAEGVIRSAADLAKLAPSPRNRDGNVLNVTLADGVACDWSRLKRHFTTTSSCGLCGRESIAALRRRLPRVNAPVRVTGGLLAGLPGKLRAAQAVFAATGGLHGAGLFNARGRLLVAREDIGRHNAVDKVLGWGLLNGKLPFDRHLLLVSGRASFEIVQKALAARVPVLCAVSAPSSLAVELAQSAGMTLVGFLRDGSMNVYCGSRRVKNAA
jgi:formate dehydrogenase accessory protein FdhD